MKPIRLFLLCAAIASATHLLAQTSESGYFTDGFLYRYQLNPAIANEQSFFAFPAIGNIDMALTGSLSLSDFIYNVDGKTTTFMNPAVSTQEFMSNIKDKNRIGTDLNLALLAIGFKGMGGYNTIGVNLRTNTDISVPGALFSLLKEGIENKSYDLTNFDIYASAWAEIALGHSHRINDHLRIGATLKALIGGGDISAKFRNATLTLADDSWNIKADEYINASIKGLQYEESYNDRTKRNYVDNASIDGAGIGGYGGAVDLGVEYRLNRDWSFSISVTDLGFINWSNNMVASTNGEQSVNTSDYIFNVDSDADNSFSNEWHEIRDKLSLIYQLENNGDMGSRTTMLATTLHAAIDYTIPGCNRLSFGLLNTTRLNNGFNYTNFRISANYAPSRTVSMGINGAYGTFGAAFGWIINLHPPGFNLFLASDCTPFRLAKQGIPLSANTRLNIGINFPL